MDQQPQSPPVPSQTPEHGTAFPPALGVAPVAPQVLQGAPARLAPRDSGLLLGLASIVLGFLQLWVIGLPLAIVSLVRSHKTKVSSTFGIIGVVINVFILGVSVFRVAASLSTYPGAQDHTGFAMGYHQATRVATNTAVGVPVSGQYSVSGGDAPWVFADRRTTQEATSFYKGDTNMAQRGAGTTIQLNGGVY